MESRTLEVMIIGASEASPLVSHARGPGGVYVYVCMSTVDRHTIFAFVTCDPLPISM